MSKKIRRLHAKLQSMPLPSDATEQTILESTLKLGDILQDIEHVTEEEVDEIESSIDELAQITGDDHPVVSIAKDMVAIARRG